MKNTVETMPIATLKAELVGALQADANHRAANLCRRLFAEAPTAATAAWLERCVQNHGKNYFGYSTRIAFLRSFTIEPVVQLLGAETLSHRIATPFFIGEFNAYSQELLDNNSALKTFHPDLTFLCLLTRSVVPELISTGSLGGATVSAVVGRCCSELENLFNAFLATHSGVMVVSTLDLPQFLSLGIVAPYLASSPSRGIEEINRFIVSFAADHPRIRVLDINRLISTTGSEHWNDTLRWGSIGLPLSPTAVRVLAHEISRFVLASSPFQRKVLVTDLDNTLWRGVIGEDGIDGIEVGGTGKGLPHQLLQAALLDLSHRGVLLAICSKNNFADAWEVLQKHPGMLLRPQHFSAVRINWEDKQANLQEIAKELNVGLDSLAFLDDSVVERELMEIQLPEVLTLPVTSDPTTMVKAIYEEPSFERISLTSEDMNRSTLYLQQRQHAELRSKTPDVTAYLHALKIRVSRVTNAPPALERIAQLTQKTNQFNLTTQRYSVADIEAFERSDSHTVMGFQVTDRFGDNGIVAVAILRLEANVCEIDSLLMSCRVISRGIESALLYAIVQQAEKEGCNQITGTYVITAKNAPAANYFQDHGFIAHEGVWQLDRSQWCNVKIPAWIELA